MDACSTMLHSISTWLNNLLELDLANEPIQVREAVDYDGSSSGVGGGVGGSVGISVGISVESTVDRELMGLVSHSIHHLAIIVLIAKSHGCNIDGDLGKAPSTIMFERQM